MSQTNNQEPKHKADQNLECIRGGSNVTKDRPEVELFMAIYQRLGPMEKDELLSRLMAVVKEHQYC